MDRIRNGSNQITDEEKRKQAIDLLESWLQNLNVNEEKEKKSESRNEK
jgi:hypothetical protein